MANAYLLLFSGGGMPEGEEETKRVMAAWESWMGKYGESITDPGNPFTPSAKTIGADGSVSDGAGANPPTGYVTIKAESLDDAVKIAKECPVLLGGASITVHETFDVMSMTGAGARHDH
jgi:hypothetical protein